MFNENNTNGASKIVIDAMNAELNALMSDVDKNSIDYKEIENKNIEFILKKYDSEIKAVIDFFFGKD